MTLFWPKAVAGDCLSKLERLLTSRGGWLQENKLNVIG